MKPMLFPVSLLLAALHTGCAAAPADQAASTSEPVPVEIRLQQAEAAPTPTAARCKESVFTSEKHTVTIDAEISIPETDTWYTQTIRPALFPKELLSRIMDFFFPDQIFFAEDAPRTTSEIEAALNELETALPNITENGSIDAVTGAQETQAWLEEQLETAPEVDLSPVLSRDDVIEKANTDGVTVYADLGFSQSSSLTVFNIDTAATMLIAVLDPENLCYATLKAKENMDTAAFPKETALKMAESLLRSLDITGFVPTSVEPAAPHSESGVYGYAICCSRALGGLPVSQSDLRTRPGERILQSARYHGDELCIRITPAGIVGFEWANYGICEEAMPLSTPLLSLDAVLPTAKELLSALFSVYGEETVSYASEIVVQRIALEYCAAPSPEDPDAFRIEPAWVFYGDIRAAYENGDWEWQYAESGGDCFLALSAIDGRDLLPEGDSAAAYPKG